MSRVRSFLSCLAVVALTALPVAAQDILDKVQQQQALEAQRVELEVANADRNATLVGKTDPARAVEILKNAQALLEADTALSVEKRAALKRKVELGLRAFQGAQSVRSPLAPVGPNPRQIQAERDRLEGDLIARKMEEIRGLRNSGQTVAAARLEDSLRGQFPNTPAIVGGAIIGNRPEAIASARAQQAARDEKWIGAIASIEKSAIPETREYTLPANWKELSEKRAKNSVQMTETERAIMKALNTPITVDFDDKATFEGALNYLSKTLNISIIAPAATLMEVQVTSETPIKLKADRVTLRTVLKKMLAEVNLTYVIKDQAIQVMTVQQAKETLTSRAYYVGDLVQVVDVRMGPYFNQLQYLENVNRIMAMIVQSVNPLSWDINGGPGKIGFDPITMSIVVRQTAETHLMLGVGLR